MGADGIQQEARIRSEYPEPNVVYKLGEMIKGNYKLIYCI